jgi:hypothetical protein
MSAQLSAPNSLDENLEAWLQEQARKLQALKAQEQRLKIDFVANSRAKGRILRAVRERLKETPGEFKTWVEAKTDISYSTALLWIDLDENYDKVKEGIAHSNTLESTVRQIRDAIRDMRQAEGRGKPGSGRKKAAIIPKESHSFEGNHEPQVEQKGSLAWGLRQRWEINLAEPNFDPAPQSDEDLKAARLCFQHAMKPDSTYATVAQATGQDEEEVIRLLRGLDIDKLDAAEAESRRQAENDLTAAQTQAAERSEAEKGSAVDHAQQTDPTPDDAKLGAETFFHHGCKDFHIEDDRTLSLTDQHGNRAFIVSEEKGIAKLLAKAVTSYTSKGGEK